MAYLGYVNLSDHDNYQSVYGSQLYGTFFSLFARFQADKLENDHDGKSYLLNQIDFKLINYKGITNIGLNEVSSISHENNALNLEVQIRALESKSEISLKNLNLKLSKNDRLIVNRKLLKLHPSGQALENGIFDEEFYFREGPQPNGEYKKKSPNPNTPINSKENVEYPGFICTQGESLIL